ncbi:MAG: ABC transporter permease [Chloroflexota bacterium]
MKNTLTIAAKEFKSYLSSPMAYIVTGIFLLGTGFLFAGSSTTYYETSIRGFLGSGLFAILFLVLAAVLTMRLIAEEKKLGTIELLRTAPVSDSEVVVGKFLGSLGILLVMLALTLFYPILLVAFGDPDLGPIAAGYLGLLLLGGASLAVGVFASSLTSNQIVAAVVGGGILIGLWLVDNAAGFLPQSIANVLNYVSFSHYFTDFALGIIDTRAIVYYLSITALFLFLAIRSLENSRWN